MLTWEATVAATARLEVRVRPESKALLERAAALAQVPVSDFVRTAAETRAQQLLDEHDATTTVPAGFFDDLMAALDAPAQPRGALAQAARRARGVVTRE